MKNPSRTLTVLAATAMAVTGCVVLTLTPQQFQSLVLHFRISQAVASGEQASVHMAVYPGEVKIRNRWIKISGRLDAPDGGGLPDVVEVEVVSTNAANNSVLNRFKTPVSIDGDGTFSKSKKFKRDLPAGTMQEFLVRPLRGDLESGTEITLCVDMFDKKSDAKASTDCGVVATPPPPPGADTVVVEVGDNFFSPKSVTIQPGQTVRWVLVGHNANHTTTAMVAADWDSGFVFVAPGAFFERNFPVEEDGLTFQYRCLTHDALGMKGSVRVGNNAPPPGGDYGP